MRKIKLKLLLVVGPTASGKSALAVRLAKKFNGEIISADSRQVYRGLDIGTGKITKQEMRQKLLCDIFRFVKHQYTWWKKDERIHWICSEKETERLIKKFI